MRKKKNIVDQIEKVLNEDKNTNRQNEADALLHVGGIKLNNFITVAHMGFPLPENHSFEKERERFMDSEKEWNSFLQANPVESDWKNIKTYGRLSKLIFTSGVCPFFRPLIWMKTSGTIHKRSRNLGYFESILRSHKEFPSKKVEHAIELDLQRTFPEHVYFEREADGISKMRNILLAYSWRNPLTSYCQCFNYIVGLLLLHFKEEEDVFWLFVQIVEEILPTNYYDRNLFGARVDCKIFNTLFSIYIPEVYKHFKKYRIDPGNIFITGWFMSLFVTAFPPSSVLRIWDVFFLEGPNALFRVGLGYFKYFKDRVMETEIGTILDVMKILPSEVDEETVSEIIRIGFSFKSLKLKYIERLRGKYSSVVDKEIEESLKKKDDRERKRRQEIIEDFTEKFTQENKEKKKKIKKKKKKKKKRVKIKYKMEEEEDNDKVYNDPLLGGKKKWNDDDDEEEEDYHHREEEEEVDPELIEELNRVRKNRENSEVNFRIVEKIEKMTDEIELSLMTTHQIIKKK